jgi:hypothetical protein
MLTVMTIQDVTIAAIKNANASHYKTTAKISHDGKQSWVVPPVTDRLAHDPLFTNNTASVLVCVQNLHQRRCFCFLVVQIGSARCRRGTNRSITIVSRGHPLETCTQTKSFYALSFLIKVLHRFATTMTKRTKKERHSLLLYHRQCCHDK